MPFYPVMPPDVTPGCAEDAALGLLGQAGMVAVRVADLASPARAGAGQGRPDGADRGRGGPDPVRGPGGVAEAGGGGARGGAPRRAGAGRRAPG